MSNNTVYGKVTDNNDMPLANIKVEVYSVGMREWQLLAETYTERGGTYKAEWPRKQAKGRQPEEADIAVKALTQKTNIEIYRSSMDEVRFYASDREEINIKIPQPLPKEDIEFSFLVGEISRLAQRIAIADLQESEEHRDITFLANELEVSTEKIEHLVIAHRIAKSTKIDPAFFYALFRMRTLIRTNAKDKNTRISISFGDDENIILYDMALTDNEKINDDIRQAADEMIITAMGEKDFVSNLRILSTYTQQAKDYYENEHPQKMRNVLTTLLNENNTRDIREIADTPKDNKRYAGIDKSVLDKVALSRKIETAGDIKKLARLNKAEWMEELLKTSPGIDVEQLSAHASQLARKMELEFPTIAFAAQLERADTPVLKNQEKIVAFLNKYDDFDLTKDRVDLYLREKKVDAKDAEAIGEELKSVQRVFRLVPNYSKTMALREERITSSQSISAIGEKRFINEIAPKAGIGEQEAIKIYQLAETRTNAALMMMGYLQDSLRATDIASFNKALLPKIATYEKDFPNLKSLFKLTDNLECDDGRSVYSPAAYLVELLQFLENRTVAAGNGKAELFKRRPDLGDIDLGGHNSNTPVKYIDLVCEILEEAIAPDDGIAYIGVLSSDPANPYRGKIAPDLQTAIFAATGLKITDDAIIFETESPYTDPDELDHYLRDDGIVYKIVKKGSGRFKLYRLRQTCASAEELDAAPEYVNKDAYKILSESKYAFKLPFDLFHAEAKEYLNRFGVDRADLMMAFRNQAIPTDVDIAAERLGLTIEEKNIITTPSTSDNNAQQKYWNVPGSFTVVDYLIRVDRILDKTGLTYKELELLLKLKFIDKNGNMFIRHEMLNGDTSEKYISNLDIDGADRIHRFLRLQKKTGLKFDVLDEIISQEKLGNGHLDEKCILIIADLMEIAAKTAIKIDELIGCFGELPHRVLYEGMKPLYAQIFLNAAKNGAINDSYLVENVANRLFTLEDSAFNYAANCLQMKTADLAYITPFLHDDKLSFSNLSYLYAAAKLIAKLKIKAEEYAAISRLSGIGFITSPEQMKAFLGIVDNYSHSRLKATDAEFILDHKAANIEDRELKDEKVEEILNKLKTGYEAVRAEYKSKYDDSLTADDQKEVLQQELMKLRGISEEDAKILLQFLDDTWTFAWIDDDGVQNNCSALSGAVEYLKYKLEDIPDIDSICNKLSPLNDAYNEYTDAFDNYSNNSEDQSVIDAYEIAGTAYENARKDLAEAFLLGISTYNILSNKQTLLEQTVSSAFKIDVELTKTVLGAAQLKQPDPIGASLNELLFDDFSAEISPANNLQQYSAIRLLSKLLVLIDAFELSTFEVEWYLRNNEDTVPRWFGMDTIPYLTGQNATPFSSYLEFAKIVSLSRRFAPVVDPLDAERPVSFLSMLDMVLEGTAARDAFMAQMSLLTGYDKEILADIDSNLISPSSFAIGNYKYAKTWERLIDCAEYSRKLGTGIKYINEYINSTLSFKTTELLRANLKARYDEDTWLSTLKEIMDVVRPQKRDALAAYLLAKYPNEYKDENDLYEQYLVDVEMEAGMPSSRIVLAHNSIQLFVQRCLMGLESNAIADINADPDWSQWQWMKNYRVWEANRKIFLYPENWYDVTLTDDKSYLLQEFIDEIQQDELTNESAEEALIKYLEKLDDIAFLEVMASWYDETAKIMHVFARTKGGEPYIYYYRRFEKERYWSPWEKIELDISGDHLLGFMRNNRLCLAWPQFSEETSPDQESTIPSIALTDGSITRSDTVPTDKPKKKMKIQMAISEYSNKKWKPKKISSESLLIPSGDNYIDESVPGSRVMLNKESYKFIFSKDNDQIWVLRYNNKQYTVAGKFDIAGCKGYLELAVNSGGGFSFILPQFSDTEPVSQRYRSLKGSMQGLSVINNQVAYMSEVNILGSTPDTFNITHPHQETTIDSLAWSLALALEYLKSIVNKTDPAQYITQATPNKTKSFGGVLPYFFEDKNHAYVIIPGFYEIAIAQNGKNGRDVGSIPGTHIAPLTADYYLIDKEKRTASDILGLSEDIANWYNNYLTKYDAASTDSDPVYNIIRDESFQHILFEIRKIDLTIFHYFIDILKSATNDPFITAFEEDLESEARLKYGELFKNLYHPFVCPLRAILYKNGVPALMKRDTQLMENFEFFNPHYKPNAQIVPLA